MSERKWPAEMAWQTTARFGEHDGTGHVYVTTPDGKKLCSVWGPRAQKIALANLWSGAPNLYEALDACRKHAAIFTGPDDDVANSVLGMADAALAKARGE